MRGSHSRALTFISNGALLPSCAAWQRFTDLSANVHRALGHFNSGSRDKVAARTKRGPAPLRRAQAFAYRADSFLAALSLVTRR